MKNFILLGFALLMADLSFAQNGRSKAEVFIQLEDRGNFTVYLDNEFIGSANGKFRFYEVYNSSSTLSILQGNKKIFSAQLDTRPEERLILSYGSRQGLRTINRLKIYRNGEYALDDFDGYVAYNTGIVPPRPSTAYQENNFENLLGMVKREPFDDEKVKLVQVYAANSRLTTAQTAVLLQQLLKDENKLVVAKSVLPMLTDPQNFYSLKDSFTFISGKEEFMDYLQHNNSIHRRRMGQNDFEQLKASIKKESFDDNKAKLMQVAFQNSAPTTAQVGELLKLYSFEEKALSSAQLAYPAVVDKQHYYTLKEIFKFMSNQNAFLDFLNRQ